MKINEKEAGNGTLEKRFALHDFISSILEMDRGFFNTALPVLYGFNQLLSCCTDLALMINMATSEVFFSLEKNPEK